MISTQAAVYLLCSTVCSGNVCHPGRARARDLCRSLRAVSKGHNRNSVCYSFRNEYTHRLLSCRLPY